MRDRYYDSFAMCARETDITTVLQCVRYYDITTVLQCVLERPILRQFCNVFSRDQYYDSFAMCAILR